MNIQIINKEFKQTVVLDAPGICGFDIFSKKALVSHDSKLIEYDLVSHQKTAETILESPMNSLAIHPINPNVFAIGDLRVDTYDDVQMISPTLVATLSGKITCIKYSFNGKIMGIASEENSLIISRESRISRCKPGHDGMTLGCQFDPKERFVSSIGCDGCLIIYQLSSTPQLLSRYTISKPISPDINQKLQCDFHPSGDSLWVAGKINAQYIMTEDEPQELQQQYQILHRNEICIIKWIKEHCLVTASICGEIKMWHFKSYTDLSLHWSIDIKSAPMHIKVGDETLYIMDCNGNLIETALDAPLTDYEKIYKDKNSALQDLLDRKVRKKEKNIEEEVVEENEELNQINDIPKQKQVTPNSQAMQDVLRPGETPLSKGRQFLCYNTVGNIISCRNTNMLEFEFFDSTFYKKFKMQNQQRFAFGVLNYRGCVLASKGPNDIDDDGYLAGEGKSIVRFQQFIGDVDDFELQLPEEEGAELLAIGNDWFAIMSDHGVCRVVAFCGLELGQFNTNRPIVSMCAYEHLLCILYHESLPILNSQAIKAKIYNVDIQCCIDEIDIFLSPFSSLTWVGYSDEGLLATQDSKGVVRVCVNQNWIQVFRNTRQWLYGIQDYMLCLLKTDQPLASQRQEMTQANFDYSILCSFEDEKVLAIYKNYLHKYLIQEQEQYRWREFGKYYYARNDDKQVDILVRYTQNLYDQNKMQELQLTLRKYRVDLFKAILSESKDKAIEFFRTHVKQDYDMNSIVSLLELQRDKQPNNKEIIKLLTQIKLIQRQQLIKSQQHYSIDNKPQSPKRKGFGLQRPVDINLKLQQELPQKQQMLQVSDQKHQMVEEDQEDFNPFARSQASKQQSIFDIGEKRKTTQTFGAQNIKKKP